MKLHNYCNNSIHFGGAGFALVPRFFKNFELLIKNQKNMPVRKVQGGYQWGKSGKVYPTAAQAERQGKAILASGWRETKKIK